MLAINYYKRQLNRKMYNMDNYNNYSKWRMIYIVDVELIDSIKSSKMAD